MTKDLPTTPDEQSEPVMDGAMDHDGPPPVTDRSGHTVDLSMPDQDELVDEDPDLVK